MNRRRLTAICVLIIGSAATAGWTHYREVATADAMTKAAGAFVKTLDKKQQAAVILPVDSKKRVQWHFIPKKERKGLQIKHMDDRQRTAAYDLLRSALSQVGYDKATKIMELEAILRSLEGEKARFVRDTERYYFTLFGQPAASGRWGLSIEGHHLSLNFLIDSGKVVSSTPQFLGANPAVVMGDYVPQISKGLRVLAREETLAFDLVDSLSAEQEKVAVLAEKAFREIRAAGEPQPPAEKPAGLPASKLNEKQNKLLDELIEEYLITMPGDVAEKRRRAIEKAGRDKIHFAWAGAKKPGIGHYYRVQGPTFLIEFVNTQPDPAGNPANHVHCIWRDMDGDFGIPR